MGALQEHLQAEADLVEAGYHTQVKGNVGGWRFIWIPGQAQCAVSRASQSHALTRHHGRTDPHHQDSQRYISLSSQFATGDGGATT